MAKPDPIVRWETAALRESAERRKGAPAPRPEQRSRRRDAWVTLRDAHYETGLPIETLRKWARRNHVPSELRSTEFGERRMIDLVAVEDRARRLGRPLEPVPLDAREEPDERTVATAAEPATSSSSVAGADSGDAVVDLRPHESGPQEPPPEAIAPTPVDDGLQDPTQGAPPGTMIVPIAAWDRMLMQLGNLHEAGQQLADARERAAKAETEAVFLRERLSELRRRYETSGQADTATDADAGATTETSASQEEAPAPATASPRDPVDGEKLWQYVVRGWRARRHRS